MDRVAAGAERRLDDGVVAQVALAGRARTEADDPIGAAGGEPVRSALGAPTHALEAELAGRRRTIRTAISPRLAMNTRFIAGATRNSGAPYSTSCAVLEQHLDDRAR